MTASGRLVQFYSDDEQTLVSNAAAFLDKALLCEGGAIAITTAAHRDALMRALAADAPAAINNGLLVFKDAGEVLDRVMEHGFPDAVCFDAIVGAALRELRARCGVAPVHAFGELLALLWSAGQHSSAIRVEQLWSALQKNVPFNLYCTYSIDVTDPKFDPDALRALMRAHSRFQATTPPDSEEAASA